MSRQVIVGYPLVNLPEIDVAVGIIFNAEKTHVLVARRDFHKHQGGLWEFPGGKFEPGETALHALKRELAEELGITIIQASNWLTIDQQYEDCFIHLQVLWVEDYHGEPYGREGQPIKWVAIKDELAACAMPDANKEIINMLLNDKTLT